MTTGKIEQIMLTRVKDKKKKNQKKKKMPRKKSKISFKPSRNLIKRKGKMVTATTQVQQILLEESCQDESKEKKWKGNDGC